MGMLAAVAIAGVIGFIGNEAVAVFRVGKAMNSAEIYRRADQSLLRMPVSPK
jgi:hypothetical protein